MSCAAHRPCMHAETCGGNVVEDGFPHVSPVDPCRSPVDADRSVLRSCAIHYGLMKDRMESCWDGS